MTDLTLKIPLKMAWDYSSPRRGSEALPLVYGDMSAGGQGGLWQAVCVDTASYVYALAGHGLLSAAASNEVTLFDQDGQTISSDDYALNLAHDFQGQGVIATATFSAEAKSKEPISVRAKGKPDAEGELMENPVSVAHDLLTQVCGISEEELDQTAFSRAWSRAQALAYQAAGVVNQAPSAASLLTEMLGTFLGSWWRGADGRLKVFLDLGAGSLNENDVAVALPQAHLRQITVSAKLSELVNQVTALYCFNYQSEQFEAAFAGEEGRDLKSLGLYGSLAKELELGWVRHSTTAATICARLVGLLAAPRRMITCEEDALVSILLEKGDAVLFSLDWLHDQDGRSLKNQIVRVLGMEPQLDQGTIRFTLLDTGLYKTIAYLADGGSETYIYVTEGGSYLLTEDDEYLLTEPADRVADGSTIAGGKRDTRDYGA